MLITIGAACIPHRPTWLFLAALWITVVVCVAYSIHLEWEVWAAACSVIFTIMLGALCTRWIYNRKA